MVEKLSAQVFKRDHFTCQVCGAEPGDPSVFRPRKALLLKIGYIARRSKRCQDVPDNLRSECTDCYEGLRFVALPGRNHKQLFSQLRRATIDDQRAAFEWLQRKFRDAS